MTYVTQPYPGFQLRPKYTKIISNNPPQGGRLFQDPNKRRGNNTLAALYLGSGHDHYHYGEVEATNKQRYPGVQSTTTFQNDDDSEY